MNTQIENMLNELEILIAENYENASIHSELVSSYNHLVRVQDKLGEGESPSYIILPEIAFADDCRDELYK
jgi:hypothetical protein